MSRHLACVSCCNITRLPKLISCLHALCVPCLEQHVQYNGSIKCPKCLSCTTSTPAGCSPLLSLPNVPADEVESGGRGGDVITCDECAEKESAVGRCADCNMNLCDVHASGHPRSRATHNHQVTPLADGEQQDPASQRLALHRCALHPSQPLTQFCVQCSRLLCQHCMDTGREGHREHEISSIDAAATKMRKTVASNLHRCVSNSDGVISHAIDNLKAAIQTIHDDAEAASQLIADYFKPLKAAVQAREQALFGDVDRRRNKALLLLENQVSRLEAGLVQGRAVSDLFRCSHDNTDFLRMWKWLNTAVEKNHDMAEHDAEPCTASLVAFSGSNAPSIIEQLEQVGAVLDTMADGRVCVAEDVACVNEDLVVVIESDASASVVMQASIGHLRASVSDPENGELAVSALRRSSSGRLEAKCVPVVVGQHSVSVTFGGKHFPGSPAFVSVRPKQVLFDETRCHGSIAISNTRRTVRKTAGEGHHAVCSALLPLQRGGTSRLRIRLDATRDGDFYVCACSAARPELDDVHGNRAEVFGWRGYQILITGRCNGGALGQKWQSGDVICLTLDHDAHTLTGLHERTDSTEVLENVTGQLYWYVSLYYVDDQATIL